MQHRPDQKRTLCKEQTTTMGTEHRRDMTSKMAVYSLLIVCLSAASVVLAFPDGAPSELCGSPLGRPLHNETLPQSSCSPFRVFLNSSIYAPNSPINITIYGNGALFKGFLLTADTTTGIFDGTCLNTTTDAKAVPSCGMTHSNSAPKVSVSLVWYPPPVVHVGNIQFKLVVVQDFLTYWTDIRSPLLKPSASEYYSLKDIWDMGWLRQGAGAGAGSMMPQRSMGSLRGDLTRM